MSVVLFSRCRNEETDVSLPVGELSIGRSPDADISLPKDWTLLSALHLSLQFSSDGSLY